MERVHFVNFPSIKNVSNNSMEFAQKLLKKKKVALVPGVAFGDSCEGFVRISYASSFENLKEAIERIGDFIK